VGRITCAELGEVRAVQQQDPDHALPSDVGATSGEVEGPAR
jgi:hypothetical protein